MDRTTRVVMVTIVIGLLTPFARAAAESKPEKEARCTEYADKAVAQYNQAIAHPQCKINVDLVWQPSREFHHAACMKGSRDTADVTTKTRETTLQLCATGPAQTASMPLPAVVEQCERSLLKFCGTWTLNGEQYAQSLSDGSKAILTVTRFDEHSIALHRVDTPDSKNAGMTADYLGNVDGGKMKGKVTYTWPGHIPPVGYGTWDATFTPAPSQPAAAAPPATNSTPSAAPAPIAHGRAEPTQSTPPVAVGSQSVSSANAGDCQLPAMPMSWFNASNKVSSGQLWKINKGTLSYVDAIEHKPMTYAISRPMFWRRWAACAPPQFKPQIADESGYWIWISDDRREAKLFELMSGNHMQMIVRSVPVNLVLADEAQTL